MNLFELVRLLAPGAWANLWALTRLVSPEAWLGAAALAVALLALLAALRGARRQSRERSRLDDMRRDLATFTEASVRVAESLDHVLRAGVPAPDASMSSRRYVLMQARERLQQGESLETLATALHLCDDEKHLLRFLQAELGVRAPARVA